MDSQPRFRFRSICLALQYRTKSELERIVIFLGLNRAYSERKARKSINNKTDITNFVASLLDNYPKSKSSDGEFIAEELVKEAANSWIYKEKEKYPWGEKIEEVELTALQRSLLIDGWEIKDNKLYPLAPANLPILPKRNVLIERLEYEQWNEARRYLENTESALEQGKWESANASCRTFLNAIFTKNAQRIVSEIFCPYRR